MHNKIWLLLFVVLFSFYSLVSPIPVLKAEGAGEIVYVVKVDDAIEKGLLRYLERVFNEAVSDDAAAIVLELNTPGGFVDPAKEISTLIKNSPVPVHAYVRFEALSAGALLALSCQSLYMAPGSSIGAAEIRGMGGEELDDAKIVSAWEAAMRTEAQARGRDPQVAAAMVRRDIAIEGVVAEGELLTLTATEADEIGFIEGVVPSRAELLNEIGYAGAQVVESPQTFAERLARFITSPIVATALLTIAMAALVIEVMTAGFGVAGGVSIVAFTLFFGGHIFAGLAGREVLFLFVIGVILLLIEAFIPSFGIVGLGGVASIIASVVLSAADTGQGVRIAGMAVLLSGLLIFASVHFLKRTGLWSQVVLQYAETKDLGYVGPKDAAHLIGKEGAALTPLRPSGTADIEGGRVDVVSEGGFIPQGAKVKVIEVQGGRIVVRQLVQ